MPDPHLAALKDVSPKGLHRSESESESESEIYRQTKNCRLAATASPEK